MGRLLVITESKLKSVVLEYLNSNKMPSTAALVNIIKESATVTIKPLELLSSCTSIENEQ